MISLRLRWLFGLSILLFVAHGMEEYVMGFSQHDVFWRWTTEFFAGVTVAEATFVVFQVMLWLLLVSAAALLAGGAAQRYLMAVPGVIYVFELHHAVSGVVEGGYVPGLVTSLGFPVLAVLYWREYLRVCKKTL